MSDRDSVPLLDLVPPHAEREEELVAVFRAALKTACFIGGPDVEHFEREFAELCGVPHCVGVGSGTDALRFARHTITGALTRALTRNFPLSENLRANARTYRISMAKTPFDWGGNWARF